MYNGNGDLLAPIVVHSGQIKDLVQKNFEPNISFVETRGQLNYDVPLKVVEIIEGYYTFICFYLYVDHI